MTLHFSDIKENALGEQLMLGMGVLAKSTAIKV